jgi:hypothetical protein
MPSVPSINNPIALLLIACISCMAMACGDKTTPVTRTGPHKNVPEEDIDIVIFLREAFTD